MIMFSCYIALTIIKDNTLIIASESRKKCIKIIIVIKMKNKITDCRQIINLFVKICTFQKKKFNECFIILVSNNEK